MAKNSPPAAPKAAVHPNALLIEAGNKFGKTTVLRMLPERYKGGIMWECRCDCGKIHAARGSSLLSGKLKSCGCLVKEYQSSLPRILHLEGHRFGRLRVLKFAGKDDKRQSLWECICDCGQVTTVPGATLKAGITQSCGCLAAEKFGERSRERLRIHGLSKTLSGVSWAAMMQRCFNPEVVAYPHYGGRGIKPCAGIMASVVNLVIAIGDRPSKELTLDRINNSLGYYCGACKECIDNKWPLNMRWATVTQQNRNRRTSLLVEIDGVRKTMMEWAEEWGVPYTTARIRIYRHRKNVQKNVIAYEI